VQSIAAVGSCIVAVLLASGLIHPVLPSLGLPPLRALPPVHHLVPPQSKPIPNRSARRLQRAQQRLAKHLAQARLKGTAPVPPASHGPAAFIGSYVNWDDTSFTSLQQHLAHIAKLMPAWLPLASADGTRAIDDPAKQTQGLTHIRQHRPDFRLAPLVNHFNSARMEWASAKLAAMLANRAAPGPARPARSDRGRHLAPGALRL